MPTTKPLAQIQQAIAAAAAAADSVVQQDLMGNNNEVGPKIPRPRLLITTTEPPIDPN